MKDYLKKNQNYQEKKFHPISYFVMLQILSLDLTSYLGTYDCITLFLICFRIKLKYPCMHNVMLYVIHMFLINISETYLNENTGNREF